MAEKAAATTGQADPAAGGKAGGDTGAAGSTGQTPEQIQAAADAKAATEKAAADTAAAAADAAKGTTKSAAPEKYELTLPEGGRLDETDLKSLETVARSLGWTNEEAQQRLEEHADALVAQSERFLAETTQDPDYGGEKLETTQKLAKAALEKLRPAGTPRGDALRALLDKSGYGNHVAVISLLADIGKAMAEDAPLAGAAASGSAKKDPASVLYGGNP